MTTENYSSNTYGRSIDIETLGTNTDAAVVEIALIDFTIYLDSILVTNYILLPIRPSMYGHLPESANFSYNINTLLWWIKNPDTLTRLLELEKNGLHTSLASRQLQSYLNNNDAYEIYTRGNFDIPILQHFIRCNKDTSSLNHNPMIVHYYNVHDVRSINAIPKFKTDALLAKPDNSHHALVDAMHNITIVAAAYELPISYKPTCQFLRSLCLKTTSS